MLSIDSPTHCQNTKHHRGWPPRPWRHRGWSWRQQTCTHPHYVKPYKQHPESIDGRCNTTLLSGRLRNRCRQDKLRRPMRRPTQKCRRQQRQFKTATPTRLCHHQHCSYSQQYLWIHDRNKRRKGKNSGALKKSKQKLEALANAELMINKQQDIHPIKPPSDLNKQVTYYAPNTKGNPTSMPAITQDCEGDDTLKPKILYPDNQWEEEAAEVLPRQSLRLMQTVNDMEEDWEWKLYCGITLKWNYAEGYVDSAMPNYVHTATILSIWASNCTIWMKIARNTSQTREQTTGQGRKITCTTSNR